jgi:hypothetical protein
MLVSPLILLSVTICISIFPFLTLGFDASDPVWNEKFETDENKVVAFYHIYAQDGSNYHSVVEQQLDVLDSSGLFDQLDLIYYSTSGDKGKLFRIQNPKFKFLHYWGADGEEAETLGLLHRYCKHHPSRKVLYFHDRASLHDGAITSDFRSLMDCFVLNPSCIDTLNKFDTCGWRLSPVPHLHYLGNFWWAKCEYVNSLVDPLSIKINQTFIAETRKLSDCLNPSEHAYVDGWVTSHPKMKPADCMNASIDHTYLFGGKLPSIAHSYCPDADSKFGSTCDEATTVKYAELFTPAYNYLRMTTGKPECQRDLDKEITRRSTIWYGEVPTNYLQWMMRMRGITKFPDGTAVRPVHSKQVYYVKDNCFHPIPNAQVFYSLGLDFDKVQVIPDYHLDYYQMCGSM